MKVLKIFIIVLVFLTVVIGAPVLILFRDAGEFKKITTHFRGLCTDIKGVHSSEDITVHPITGLAFISSCDRRAVSLGRQPRQGAIFGFNLKETLAKLVNLTPDFKKPFRPHGIGLWLGTDGRTSLFVVNHPPDGHFVEIFDFKDNRFFHRESISDPLMRSPNDVIPVGPRHFYVTNDHGSTTKFGRTLEDYLRLARSYVLFYDGKHCRKVAEGLKYANGINLSADGKTVYVAATVGRKIIVYDRNPKTGDLTFRFDMNLNTGVDNIEVDQDGQLWVGAHPKLLTFVKYAKDPKVLSPSQVLKITLHGKNKYKVEEILMDRGDVFSGSSVAAVYENTLLIGSVFDPRFLLCQRRE